MYSELRAQSMNDRGVLVCQDASIVMHFRSYLSMGLWAPFLIATFNSVSLRSYHRAIVPVPGSLVL